MPVLTLACPRCGHESHSLVLEGTRPPEVWICGQCGSEEVKPLETAQAREHAWESDGTYRRACPCCGL